MQGLAHPLVGLRREMQIIIHVLMCDGTIGLNKPRVHVQKRDMRQRRYLSLNLSIHTRVTLPKRVWTFTSWQQSLVVRKERELPSNRCNKFEPFNKTPISIRY